jgi:thioredoxin-dependent peroxiredoxin
MGRQHALVGKEAPGIELPNYDGQTYTLKPGSEGVPIALFFYPKAGKHNDPLTVLVRLIIFQ